MRIQAFVPEAGYFAEGFTDIITLVMRAPDANGNPVADVNESHEQN